MRPDFQRLSTGSDRGQDDPEPSDPSTSTEELPMTTKFDRTFRKSQQKLPNWEDSWSWEVGAAVLSTIGIGLLIGFLIYVDGTRYADWQYQMSPNTVVSVIVTVTKAAMLVAVSSCLGQLKWDQYRTKAPLYRLQVLDQASRGPLGAIEVLWAIPPGLATAAALLTILSVAIDPFAQQLLSYPSRRVPAPDEKAFSQEAQEYWPDWTDLWYRYQGVTELDMPAIEPSMELAMLSGTLSQHTPLEPICPTQECTYPDFVSLGVCSRCEDVTNKMDQNCLPYHGLYSERYPQLEGAPIDCTYTSPHNLQIVPSLRPDTQPSEGIGVVHVVRPYFNLTTKQGESMLGIKDPMISFAALKYSTFVGYTVDNNTAKEEHPTMMECSIYYCEKQYTNNSVSSKIRSLRASSSQPLFSVYPDGNVNISKAVLVPLVPQDRNKSLSKNSNYTIDMRSQAAISQQLSGFFNTTGTEDWGSKLQTTGILYSVKDFGAAMASLADSMTDVIRTNTKAVKLQGEAFLIQPYVHVRWSWILLPAASVVFTVVLLLVMIVKSKDKHTILWKSSVLPLLVSHLDTREYEFTSVPEVSRLHHLSRKAKVQLERDDGCPVLREH